MASFKDTALRAPGGVLRGTGKELGGFKKFILRGNVVDLAVGIISLVVLAAAVPAVYVIHLAGAGTGSMW